MAYGKETFRGKYREVNNSLSLIKDNYYELDYEYQMLAKRVNEAIEYIKENDYHYMNEYALERFKNNLLVILGDKENE